MDRVDQIYFAYLDSFSEYFKDHAQELFLKSLIKKVTIIAEVGKQMYHIKI